MEPGLSHPGWSHSRLLVSLAICWAHRCSFRWQRALLGLLQRVIGRHLPFQLCWESSIQQKRTLTTQKVDSIEGYLSHLGKSLEKCLNRPPLNPVMWLKCKSFFLKLVMLCESLVVKPVTLWNRPWKSCCHLREQWLPTFLGGTSCIGQEVCSSIWWGDTSSTTVDLEKRFGTSLCDPSHEKWLSIWNRGNWWELWTSLHLMHLILYIEM